MSEVEKDLTDLFNYFKKPDSVETHPTFLFVMFRSHLEHGHAQTHPVVGRLHTFLSGLRWKGAEEREVLSLIEQHRPDLKGPHVPGMVTRATALTPKI